MRFSEIRESINEIRESINEIREFLILSNKGLDGYKKKVMQAELLYENNPTTANRYILETIIEETSDQMFEIINDEIWDRINDPDDYVVKDEYLQFDEELRDRLRNL